MASVAADCRRLSCSLLSPAGCDAREHPLRRAGHKIPAGASSAKCPLHHSSTEVAHLASCLPGLTALRQSKTPEQSPRVMNQSRIVQWQWSGEAAGVGAWGRTFQVWVGWLSGGHLRRCRWSVDQSGARGESQRRRLLSCPAERPAHSWVKTVGAGACSQRCF